MNRRDYEQPSAPPPPYYSVVNEHRQDPRLKPDLDQFIQRYESNSIYVVTWHVKRILSFSSVNPATAQRLQALKGYEIVFICDDSGSMSASIGESMIGSVSSRIFQCHFQMNHPTPQDSHSRDVMHISIDMHTYVIVLISMHRG